MEGGGREIRVGSQKAYCVRTLTTSSTGFSLPMFCTQRKVKV